jgi:hypothetical protein
MQLYKFTLIYSDGNKATYFRGCKYPKKTAIYRKSFELLDSGEIIRFSYGPFNTKL